MTQEGLFPEGLTPEAPTEERTETSPTRSATRREQARLYKPVRNQVEMMLRDLDSLLPEEHLARAIWALAEILDWEGLVEGCRSTTICSPTFESSTARLSTISSARSWRR
jgi:hypothetical protein